MLESTLTYVYWQRKVIITYCRNQALEQYAYSMFTNKNDKLCECVCVDVCMWIIDKGLVIPYY